MIRRDQTTLRTRRMISQLVLFGVLTILAPAAMLRADDQYAGVDVQFFAALVAPLDDQPEDDRTDAATKLGPEKATDQPQIRDEDLQKLERLLEEFRKLLQTRRLENIAQLRSERFKTVVEDASEQMRWVGRGFRVDEAKEMGELKKLGFDDKLIETLIRDPAKEQAASRALQDIIKLTGENQIETQLHGAGSEQLRMPKFSFTPEERAWVLQFLQGLDQAETEMDGADKD